MNSTEIYKKIIDEIKSQVDMDAKAHVVSDKTNKRAGYMLRSVRDANRVSLRRVAKQMGISAAYLCDLELGRRWWSVELVRQYRDGVNVCLGQRK